MTHPALIQYAVRQFRRGAIVYIWGYEMDDKKMQGAGRACAELAIGCLDELDEGRTPIVPLLDDPDLSVRVFAAGFLSKVVPERAVPVLELLAERGPAFIDMTAHYLLDRHKHGTDL